MIRVDPGDEFVVTLTLHLAVPDTGDTVSLDPEAVALADFEIDQEFIRIHGPGHFDDSTFELQDLTATIERPNVVAYTRRG